VFLDPPAAGESQKLVLLQPAGEGPVDLLEGGPVAKPSEAEQPRESAVMPLIPFGIHKVGEQLVGGELVLRSTLHGRVEGPYHAVQLHLPHPIQRSLITVHVDHLAFQL
jgi:hypothetical protein